ncbi:MAG TPA: hypothetical protein VH333_11230 [Pseudonocardiaceae bacterium]|jgi:hypothetical protein|nr:hypothetical protein [Pseudonocardiaceae bacterium]
MPQRDAARLRGHERAARCLAVADGLLIRTAPAIRAGEFVLDVIADAR